MAKRALIKNLEKFMLDTLEIPSDVSRVRKMCAILGNPEKKLKIVHVTGTNGKGSTTRMVASILESAGYKVGLYTSPHMEKVNERIQINDRNISDEDLVRLLLKVKRAIAGSGIKPTFFELMTVIAILYYVDKKVDAAAIEVGRGGFNDATVVMDASVAILTTISLEHTEQLGRTTTAIAREKSGIIKEGCTTVTAIREKAPLAVIKKRAKEMHSRVIEVGKHIRVVENDSSPFRQVFSITGYVNLQDVVVHLGGGYQLSNAATAAAAAFAMNEHGLRVPLASVKHGLAKAFIPGRLEVVHRSPAVVLDIAHNIGAVTTLASTLQKMLKKKVILVFGISADKRISEMVPHFMKIAGRTIITQAAYRAAPIPQLEKEVKKHTKNYATAPTVAKAVRQAMKEAKKDDIILVTGSLFVVREARRVFKK